MHRLLLGLCLLPVIVFAQSSSCHCPGMNNTGQGNLYGSIGFHRVFFTKSDIRFRDTKAMNYDFTLNSVKAKDDNHFNLGKGFSAPQYSFRIGYFFNNKKGLGIEFNYDHVKYIAVPGQTVHVKGQIFNQKIDRDTVLSKNFIEYEHTDGANYYLVNFVKRKSLLHSKNEKHWLSLTLKPGAGILLPRSDTRVFGMHRNDKYHLAGYVIGMEGGLRYDFHRFFYAEASIKTAYAKFGDVLLYETGRASQHWLSLQTILVAGFQVPL
jgi:hypothetical protein